MNAIIGLKEYFCLSNNINGELRLKSPPLPTLCFCKIILTDGKKKEMPPIIVKELNLNSRYRNTKCVTEQILRARQNSCILF